MSSNDRSNDVKRKKGKLDKQSSASIILAFTVVCFMFTMFMASNRIGTSYAADTNPTTPPSRLTFNGRLLGQPINYWQYMKSTTISPDTPLALGFDFRATDGTTTYEMYCIEGQIGVSGTDTYQNPTALSNNYAPGLAYILNHSYPNQPSSSYTSICSTDDSCKKYLTQYAVWYYLDLMGVKDSLGQSQLSIAANAKIKAMSDGGDRYAQAVVTLATDAVNYNSTHRDAPNVSINKNNIQYHVTSDGKFLESSEIAVTSSNRSEQFMSYTVGLTNNNCDARIIDVNGNDATSFSKDYKFKIRIPMEKLANLNTIQLGLSVVASFQTDIVYAYTPASGNGNEQRPIIANYTSTSTNSTIELNVNLVEIIKTDIESGKMVRGAVLAVVDSSGAEIHRFTTTDQPYYLNLVAGNYLLVEISSPDGYELNEDKIPFTVTDDGVIAKVEMKNTPTTQVPNTASNVSIYLYTIGIMILIIGIGVIYTTTRTNKKK